jgi:cell division GTPase FtsZ
MKVIEKRINNRTGEEVEVSWGNVITSDFSVVHSVMNILEMKRDQEAGRENPDHNPVLDRFTTIAIHIEL